MAAHQDEGKRPVGIRDVARLAGVSVTSASFALNGQRGVAEETRQRIVAAARELGYRANPQAQALRRGWTSTYGFVIRNFANPFFIEVLTGAEEVAGTAGATVVALDSRYSLDRERAHVLQIAGQRLAGLAIAPVGTGESIRLWQEQRPETPVVAVNASVSRASGVCRVRPDNGAAVELPMRWLADLGHTSVAFLSAPRSLLADPDRLRHFRRCCRALGLRGSIMYSPLTIPDVQAAVAARLASPDPPTAIITNSDYTAHAVYKAARELGLRVGPDVSVVGHDDLATSELLDPPLATISLDRREMGRALMQRLLGTAAPADYLAPVRLVKRDSVWRRPPSRAQPRPPGERQFASALQLGNSP